MNQSERDFIKQREKAHVKLLSSALGNWNPKEQRMVLLDPEAFPVWVGGSGGAAEKGGAAAPTKVAKPRQVMVSTGDDGDLEVTGQGQAGEGD